MNTRTLILLLIILWLLSRRRLAKTSQAANQSNISAPEQEPAAPNSKFQPLFDFVIPEAEIRKQQEEQQLSNPGGIVKKRRKITPEPEPEPEPEPLTGYGLLYNRVVIDAKEKSVAPAGTRIPSQTDSNTLIGYLTGNGGATIDNLISKGWKLQYAGHSFNISNFYDFDLKAYYHTTDRDLNDSPLIFVIDTELNRITSGVSGDEYSMPIRCILENPETWQPGDTVTDIDGNVYQTVKIGNQVWVNENLKTTKFNDGTPITFPESSLDWLTNPHYIYPNGDENNV